MTDMADVLLDDLAALFGAFGFAEDAIYRPAAGEEKAVRVIFDENFQEVDAKGHIPLASTGPAAFVETAALPDSVEEEDRLVVRGVAYRMVVCKPDGRGATFCRLHKAGA